MKHSRPCGKCFTHLRVRKMIPSYRLATEAQGDAANLAGCTVSRGQSEDFSLDGPTPELGL